MTGRGSAWREVQIVGCVVVIAAISVHDAALVVLNDDVIQTSERNPIGRWMIAVAEGHVWIFVLSKLMGTTTVCTIILAIQRRWPRAAITIAHVLACLQLMLLGYLSIC